MHDLSLKLLRKLAHLDRICPSGGQSCPSNELRTTILESVIRRTSQLATKYPGCPGQSSGHSLTNSTPPLIQQHVV